jgi:hypothetical protein
MRVMQCAQCAWWWCAHAFMYAHVCMFYTRVCPQTVHNFVLLAQRGEYDGTIFHRVIPEFMMQVCVCV